MNRKQIIQIGKIFSTSFVLALTTSACQELVNPNPAGKLAGVDDVTGGTGGNDRALAGNGKQQLVTNQKHPDFPNARYLVADPDCRIPGSLGARSQTNGVDIVYGNKIIQYDCAFNYGTLMRPAFGIPAEEKIFGASKAQSTASLKAEANYPERGSGQQEVLRAWSHKLSYRNDLDSECIADSDAGAFSLSVFEAITGNSENLGTLERCRIQPFNRWTGNRVTNKIVPFGLAYKFCISLPDNGHQSYGQKTVCERVSKYMQSGVTIQEAQRRADAELNRVAFQEIKTKCEKYVSAYHDPQFRINPNYGGKSQFLVRTSEGDMYSTPTNVKCTDLIALGIRF